MNKEVLQNLVVTTMVQVGMFFVLLKVWLYIAHLNGVNESWIYFYTFVCFVIQMPRSYCRAWVKEPIKYNDKMYVREIILIGTALFWFWLFLIGANLLNVEVELDPQKGMKVMAVIITTVIVMAIFARLILQDIVEYKRELVGE